VVIKPTVVPSNGGAGVPATVSTTTSESIIAAGQNRSAAHNALVLSQTGRRVGGGSKRSKRSRKSKRSKSKRSKSKRSKSKRSKSKRSKSKRSKSKRGGQPTPTPSPSPTPKPTVPVPQFSGAHNAGANANSSSSNHVAMLAGAQAALDNPNAAPSNTSLP
jgi:hypothetical protein